MKILVIDDSCAVCDLIVKFIKRKGKAEVIQAVSVDEASIALAVNDFDLIVSDISMPGQNGDDFLLANKEFVGSAKIVFISANDVERLVYAQTKLIENGLVCVEYIQKPIRIDALLSLLDER